MVPGESSAAAATAATTTTPSVTLSGNFPGDSEKLARVQALQDRLLLSSNNNNKEEEDEEGNITRTTSSSIQLLLNEIIELFQVIPHSARIQVLLKVVAPSSQSKDLILALYKWAYSSSSPPPATTGTSTALLTSNDDGGGDVTAKEMEQKMNADVDWEFVEAVTNGTIPTNASSSSTTATKVKSTGSSSSIIDASTTVSSSLLNGQRVFVMSALIAAAPALGPVGVDIFQAYISSSGQRFRWTFVNTMMSNPLVSNDTLLPILDELPLPKLYNMLQKADKSRSFRHGLINDMIQSRVLPIYKTGGTNQNVEHVMTLASTNVLEQHLDVTVFEASTFSNWTYHQELYEKIIEDKLKSFRSRVFLRASYMKTLLESSNCTEMSAILLELYLKYPSFTSSNIPKEEQTAMEDLLEEGVVTVDWIRTKATPLSAGSLPKVDWKHVRQLVEQYLNPGGCTTVNTTSTTSTTTMPSIESHALLDFLFEALVRTCKKRKTHVWTKFRWLLELGEQVFATAPLSYVAALFLKKDVLCEAEISPTPTYARRTFDLFVKIYKIRLERGSYHLELGRWIKAWTNMHYQITAKWFQESFPLSASSVTTTSTTTTNSVLLGWWLSWHRSVTKRQGEVLLRFTNNVAASSRDVVVEKKPPSRLISVLGLIDLVYASSIQSFEHLVTQVSANSEGKIVQRIDYGTWWKQSLDEERPTRDLRAVFSSSLIDPLEKMKGVCNGLDRAHILRRNPYQSHSMINEVLAAFREVSKSTETEWQKSTSRFIWCSKSQRVLACFHYGDPTTPPQTRFSEQESWTWLKEMMDIVEADWPQIIAPSVSKEHPYVWDPHAQTLVKVSYKHLMFLYQMDPAGQYWWSNCRHLYGDLGEDAPLPEPLHAEIRRAIQLSLRRLQLQTEPTKSDRLYRDISTLLRGIPEEAKAEKYFVDFLLETMMGDKEDSNVGLAAFNQNRFSLPLRHTVLKRWCEDNMNNLGLIRKGWELFPSLFPISISVVRDLFMERKSEDWNTRESYALEILQVSLDAPAEEFAKTLLFIQPKIKNERGTMTLNIYRFLEGHLDTWLPKALVGGPSLEIANEIGSALLGMLECDIARRDSVAGRSFPAIARKIVLRIFAFDKEIHRDVSLYWITLAVEMVWTLSVAKSGEAGLEDISWPTRQHDYCCMAPWISRSRLPTLLEPLLDKVDKKYHDNIIWKLGYTNKYAGTALDVSKPRMAPAMRVQTLISALDAVRLKHGITDSCVSLTSGRWLDNNGLYNRIINLFRAAGDRWLEVPFLTGLLDTISAGLLDYDPSTMPPLHLNLSMNLFEALKYGCWEKCWHTVPVLVRLCDAIFQASVERCRGDLDETDCVNYAGILEAFILSRKKQGLRQLFGKLDLSLPVRIFVFTETYFWDCEGRLEGWMRSSETDMAELMSQLFTICDKSVIHLPEMQLLLNRRRSDLMGMYLPQHEQKDATELPFGVFPGVFRRILRLDENKRFGLDSFLPANSAELSSVQANALSQHLLETAMSTANNYETRTNALERLAAFPTIDHEGYIRVLSQLYSSNQSALLETFILRSFDHDGCVLILSFLLRPETIAVFPHRVLAMVLNRLPSKFRGEQFMALLSVLLSEGKRRNGLSMTLHKSLLRLLFTCPTHNVASDLLWKEWQADLSESVRLEVIRLTMGFICPEDIADTSSSPVPSPLRTRCWNIIEDLANNAPSMPLSMLRVLCTVRYAPKDGLSPSCFYGSLKSWGHDDSGESWLKTDAERNFERIRQEVQYPYSEDYPCFHEDDQIHFEALLATASENLLRKDNNDADAVALGYLLYDQSFHCSSTLWGGSDFGRTPFLQLEGEVTQQFQNEIASLTCDQQPKQAHVMAAERYIGFQRPFLYGAVTGSKLCYATTESEKHALIASFKKLYNSHLEFVLTTNAFQRDTKKVDDTPSLQRNFARDRALFSLIALLRGVDQVMRRLNDSQKEAIGLLGPSLPSTFERSLEEAKFIEMIRKEALYARYDG